MILQGREAGDTEEVFNVVKSKEQKPETGRSECKTVNNAGCESVKET